MTDKAAGPAAPVGRHDLNRAFAARPRVGNQLAGRLRALAAGNMVPGLIGLALFAVLWEIVARAGLLNSMFFAPISNIAVAAWDMYSSGFILIHLGYTLANFMAGFVIGTIAGIPLGLLLGWYRGVLKYVDPIISVALATPVIVLVPLVIVMFGIFWESKVAITVWAVFFPVLVSMIAGVQGADAGLIKVARSFQANDLKIIRDVVLPGAVPSLVGGLRLALARGLIAALAAEFFGSQRGLGFLAFSYSTTFQPARMFVAILTMAAAGVLLTEMIKVVQRRFDSWRPEHD